MSCSSCYYILNADGTYSVAVPKSCSCPPSPTPPWARAIQSPLTQVITQADTVNLTVLTTFFNAALSDPAAPVAVTLPDGNYVQQEKRLMIAGDKLATTEKFIVTGTFAGGYTKLVFNGIGFNAVLVWDSSAWTIMGGNAELQP
jgi:hypothetical protein